MKNCWCFFDINNMELNTSNIYILQIFFLHIMYKFLYKYNYSFRMLNLLLVRTNGHTLTQTLFIYIWLTFSVCALFHGVLHSTCCKWYNQTVEPTLLAQRVLHACFSQISIICMSSPGTLPSMKLTLQILSKLTQNSPFLLCLILDLVPNVKNTLELKK